MKAQLLRRVTRGIANAIHNFRAGDERRQQFFATGAAFLGNRQTRREQRGADMHTDTGLHEAVHLKSMTGGTIGQRGKRRAHLQRGAQHRRLARRAVLQ